MINRKHGTYIALFILVFACDRISKWWALSNAVDQYVITPWLSFDLIYNRGISWGMLHSVQTLGFVLVTILIGGVTTFLGVYAYRRALAGYAIYGEILVLAGSCANLVDRFIYGGVVDFILFSYGAYFFPVFNIADVAIVLGVAAMALAGVYEQ